MRKKRKAGLVPKEDELPFKAYLMMMVGGVVVITPMIFIFSYVNTFVKAPLKELGHCRAFAADINNPSHAPLNKSTERDSFYTRILGSERITGLLFQPLDVRKDEYALICYFSNGAVDRSEWLNTKQYERIQEISTSNYNPLSWFR